MVLLRFRRIAVVAAFLFGLMATAQAAELVRVGGYDFPPFVEDSATAPRGLTLDLIDALNKAQSEVQFRFVPTSPRRRYGDLSEGRLDAIFFESPEWEWAEKGYPADFSNVFLRGGEVFIALNKPGRGQDYFADLKGKRLVGILGYHYGFAGFNSDPDTLARTYGMKLVTTHRSSIDMVVGERVDIGIVTDAYLHAYLQRAPEIAGRLLVSDRYDQMYNHRILVRRGGPLSSATVNRLLAGMERDGTLARIFRDAGVSK
jgi:ABC-type amino acid transport substrate-binding protein